MLPAEAAGARRDTSKRQILAAQVQLLYRNAGVGVAVTLVAATVLGRLQWEVVPHLVILGWCSYMGLVSAARFILERRYWRTASSNSETNWWRTAFTLGAGLAGAGWGGAGILLYPNAQLANQVFLIFILGGMMLGRCLRRGPKRFSLS